MQVLNNSLVSLQSFVQPPPHAKPSMMRSVEDKGGEVDRIGSAKATRLASLLAMNDILQYDSPSR